MDLSNLESEPVTVVDPNVLLRKLREFAQQTMADLDDPGTADEVASNEAAMAEAFLQLDDWLSRKGFSPTAWQDSSE
jgi:hypothetical protein